METEQPAQTRDLRHYIRFAPLLLGLLLALGATGMQTWKRSALADAQGAVAAHGHRLELLNHKRAEAEGEDKKKRYADEIAELETKADDLLREVRAETVDAGSGVWFLAMVKWAGLSLLAVGFLALAVLGSSYEKAGALIGLGVLVAQFM